MGWVELMELKISTVDFESEYSTNVFSSACECGELFARLEGVRLPLLPEDSEIAHLLIDSLIMLLRLPGYAKQKSVARFPLIQHCTTAS